MPPQIDRRQFLQVALIGVAGAALSGCELPASTPPSTATYIPLTPLVPGSTEVLTGTPTGPLPTPGELLKVTETQAAVLPTVEADMEIREVLGLNREDGWPGAKLVPDLLDPHGYQNLNARTMADMYLRFQDLLNRGFAQLQEVRTFEFLQAYVGADLGQNGEPLAFTRPDITTALDQNPELIRSRSWVASEGGNFLEARELERTIKTQLIQVWRGVKVKEPKEGEINALYQELTHNVFSIKKYTGLMGIKEDIVFTKTRYLLPSGSGRASQPNKDICTVYESGIDRGGDHLSDSGTVMHKPNTSQLMPLFMISPNEPAIERKPGVGVAQIPGTDLHLNLSILDPHSRPDHQLFGFTGVPKWGEDVSGPGSLTVLLEPCAPGIEVTQAPAQPTIEVKQTPRPRNTEVPTKKPPKPKPSPMPTNNEVISTKPPQPDPPVNPQPTEIP